MKKLNITDLSEFVLHYCTVNQIHINHLKLQKVLYYIQAWHLVYFDKHPLFDNVPEAWVNGPVYKEVYNLFKSAGMYNQLVLNDELKDKAEELFKKSKAAIDIEDKQWDFIDSALNHFATKSHEQLVLSTHSEPPWNIGRKGLGPFEYSESEITHDSMYEYYHSVYERYPKK